MDLASLRSLTPSEFEDAADGYRSTSTMAAQAKDNLENQISAKMREALEGEAVNAALGELRKLTENFHYIQVECGLVGTALNAFASEARSAKKKLDTALADAEARKFTVGPDGSVSYPAAGDKVDGRSPKGGTAGGLTDDTANAIARQAAGFDPNPNYAFAQDCADRIAEALKEATEADQKWAPALRKLKADDDLTVSAEDWADAQKDMAAVRESADDYLADIKAPPKDGSPNDNAEWWKGFSEQEKADYVALRPASLGALDGLPSDVRDEANRTVLAETRGKYQMELDSIPPEPSKYVRNPSGSSSVIVHSVDWEKWNEKYGDRQKHLEFTLKGMNAVQDRFDRTGEGGLPEAYLLGFHPESNGDGRIILANGNPDTADHTAVYVPGTKSKLGKIGDGDEFGDLGRTERLWTESDKLSPEKEISTITWFDYNAPDNIVPEATRGSYADEGGPKLRQFLDGNRTAHEYATGSSAHTTVIGHSYGSTVVGVASQSGGMLDGPMADDILVAGSPGMQVNRAVDLGIRPEHMWAMGAPGDDFGVRLGGSLVGLGDNTIVPTDEVFGGNIMKSDSPDHSGFWDDDSQSLRNQAAVVTEQYQWVKLE
ncbi:alpha/beta hydrolase [Streptomyces sp. NPDC050509]|uniref:alpha/beta hydrolase n=1 Tax=Streptomyces sp. NPDC050509 TaxID=3365620 RepID=UPI003789C6D9